jgi:hypothetical protein
MNLSGPRILVRGLAGNGRTAREILLELGYSLEAVDETHVLAVGPGDQRDDHYMEAELSRRQTIQ